MAAQTEISLQASPFADDFVDVAALNAHISTRLLQRVESVKSAARAGERVPSKAIAVLGPAGGGKTHLFSRLVHRADARPTLVLLRPYFGVNITLRDVLAVIVDQLCLPVYGDDRTQLEVIASHWLGEGNDVERALEAVVSSLPEIAPAAHLARALLLMGTHESSAAWAELAWLSGREPRTSRDGTTASALGERDVLHVLRILAVLAAPVAPIVLTFDQLENLAGDDVARVLGYGNLVSEIIDSLPCFTIVQLALTSEWMQFIEPRLSLPQKSRLAHETLVLEAPDRDERELLLRAWHEQLNARATTRRRKRFPSPLSEEELAHLLSAPGMTPRMLLAALSRGFAGQPVNPATATLPSTSSTGGSCGVGTVWSVEYERVRAEFDEKDRSGLAFDPAELAEALATALAFVPQVEVTTRTERDRIVTAVKAPGHELTMLYLTSLHHVAAASVLARATDVARSTKVVIVREKRFDFPVTWEAVQERRSAFERLPNARWLWLDRDDLSRCLTLARLLSKARAKRLHLPGSDEPLSLTETREMLLRTQAPDGWESVAAITRWLSDVPRETAPTAARDPFAETKPPPTPPPEAREPTLREWLSLGRKLGRSAVDRYAGKVLDLVGRRNTPKDS